MVESFPSQDIAMRLAGDVVFDAYLMIKLFLPSPPWDFFFFIGKTNAVSLNY